MKHQLKVLHIITGLNDGGAEAVLYRLCVHDHQNSHTVISLMDDGKYGALLREIGVAVYCLNMPQGRVTITGVWRCWLLLRSLNVNLIQTWMYHADLMGGVLGRLAGFKKIIWGVHNSTLELGKSKRSTILISRLNALFSRFIPSDIVYCAHKSRQVHESMGYVVSKGVVIANGYDLSRFYPQPESAFSIRDILNIPSSIPVLGTVARFDAQKDHLNLISALGVVKKQGVNFRCLLVGKNMDDKNKVINQWLIHHDVLENTYLLGQRDDIPAIMTALDLHILPSASEAFPNVVAEAMACGTPCLTTSVGDAPLIVGDIGWVVAPQNSLELSQAILKIIELKKDAEAWSIRQKLARRRIVDNFGVEKMVDAYGAVWR